MGRPCVDNCSSAFIVKKQTHHSIMKKWIKDTVSKIIWIEFLKHLWYNIKTIGGDAF